MKCMTVAAVVGLMPGAASQAVAKPLKVFILAGQSNMQGHVNESTFDSMADDQKTAPILKEMRDANGTPHVCKNVWISSVGCAGDGWSDVIEQKGILTAGFGASTEEIGPEFTFGIYMEKLLGEPILIIKTSWGGRSLHTDFRPPSAGPYVWSDYELTQCKQRGDDLEKDKADKVKDTGVFYRHMIEHVRNVLGNIKRMESLGSKMDEEANKNPKLTHDAKDAALKKAVAEHFTPEELKRLKIERRRTRNHCIQS